MDESVSEAGGIALDGTPMNPLDLVRSLVDFKFYREVPGRTFANASAFLGMLSTVFALCLVVAMSIQIVPKLRSSLAWARDSFPEITLSEGTISSPVKGELVVRHPDAKQIVIAFDADRETPVGTEELREKRALAYLTRNALYVAKIRPILEARSEESFPGFAIDGVDTHALDKFAAGDTLVLNPAFYDRLSRQLPFLLYPVGFVVGWMIFFIWKHGAALIYSLMGLLINGFQSGRLDFPSLYKVGVFAQTPIVALQIAALFVPEPIRFFGLITFLVAGVYLWKAIAVINAELPEPPSPSPSL